MSAEFYVRFDDLRGYTESVLDIIEFSKKLNTFVKQPSDFLVWLKDKSSLAGWQYDARVFFNKEEILLEISGNSKLVHEDLRSLISYIRGGAHFRIVDEDDEVVDWWG